jgi:hypothetical protein
MTDHPDNERIKRLIEQLRNRGNSTAESLELVRAFHAMDDNDKHLLLEFARRLVRA